MFKLDKKDKQILFELSNNARISYSDLGKRLRLHKDTVAYRIKQLEKNNIISGYTAFFNFQSLGYKVYKLYLKIQGMKKAEQEQFLDSLLKDKKVGWVAYCSGSWDIIIGVIVKDVKQFYEFKIDLEGKFHKHINKSSVTTMVDAYLYPRNYLIKTNKRQTIRLFEEIKPIEIDDIDKDIIKLLAQDSRISAIDLSKKLKFTPRITLYRLKNLQKNKVISQYRISINLDKINYKFFKCFISLHNISKARLKEMMSYCNLHQNIIHNVEVLGDWTLEPEFEVEDVDKFYYILNEMRDKFSEIIKNIDTVIINREHKYGYIPF